MIVQIATDETGSLLATWPAASGSSRAALAHPTRTRSPTTVCMDAGRVAHGDATFPPPGTTGAGNCDAPANRERRTTARRKPLITGDSRSPLPDSNRRPLPDHRSRDHLATPRVRPNRGGHG